jgi:excisionase family DNA binding protein
LRTKKEDSPALPVVQPRMLTVKEAATYLGATIWFVRELVWGRKVRSLKFGKRIVFDRADLDAFVEQQKRAA